MKKYAHAPTQGSSSDLLHQGLIDIFDRNRKARTYLTLHVEILRGLPNPAPDQETYLSPMIVPFFMVMPRRPIISTPPQLSFRHGLNRVAVPLQLETNI